jgi:hypothetical protein
MKNRFEGLAGAAAYLLLSSPAWADTPAEPLPVSKGGTIIALLVMLALIVVPVIVWWVKMARSPKDKS